MQISTKQLSPTSAQLTITADQELLNKTKQATLKLLAKNVRLPGFRQGKAPLNLIEKNVDSATLQQEFLSAAVNELYRQAVSQERYRVTNEPEVEISKFVPFDNLEIKATIEIVGEVKLPDYTKIKVIKKTSDITDKDIDSVVSNLANREAKKVEVDRPAEAGDEVVIDFQGFDPKTGKELPSTDGKDYPLGLGSKSFIPGFEEQIIGLSAGQDKTFEITFPKDYGVSSMQSKKVRFEVKVKKVSQLEHLKLDDAFAAKVGPFKNMSELRADIRKQLGAEQDSQAEREVQNEILAKIVAKTEVAIPDSLIDQQIDLMERDERQNLVYRGQTWEEHLKAEGLTAEQHRENNRPLAKERVISGIVLGEIAEREKIVVTPEELEIRMQLLKGQYPDKQMQAELDKPENRQDIVGRMLSEKTMAKLVQYATSK